MAITLTEKHGREGNAESERRTYVARGTSGSEENDDVYEYAATTLPTIFGLSLRDINVVEIIAHKLWTVEAEWAKRSQQSDQSIGEVRVSSRSTLQPTNLQFSRSTVSRKAAAWFNGGDEVDFKGMVGVQADGTVAGVDVPLPHNVLSVSKIIASGDVDAAYQYACEQLVGKVNSGIYRSRAAGTLLCVGVSFGQIDDESFEVAAEFEFEPNQTGLTIGGIEDIDKGGWDYVWTYNVNRKVNGRVVPVAAQVNVERFFPTADFESVLGF